jgi:hypothetical protein
MHEEDATPDAQPSKPRRWRRPVIAQTMAAYEASVPALCSQRQFALEACVPRTTLQYWRSRKDSLDASPLVIAFFESPEGLALLHRIVGALHTVFTQVGPCGIRLVSLFLELSHLNRFVAASIGAQHQVSVSVQDAILGYGRQERGRLAAAMPAKRISVAQDETFHPETCLVAIEPVSNFILVERYSERRDAASWTEAMAEAVKDLAVEVVQATSDEGRGLLSHAREGLGAHHSPDLFHLQHEVSKGVSPALAAKTREAERACERAEAHTQATLAQRAAFDDPARGRGPGRRPAFEQRIQEATLREAAARDARAQAQQRQTQAREAIEGLSAAYHPFDLETGAAREAGQVARSLEHHIDRIDGVVTEAGLSTRAREHVEKARRVLPAMRETIAFVQLQILARMAALALGADLEGVVLTALVPGLYLRRVGAKAPTAERRAVLGAAANALLARARAPDGSLAKLEASRREQIEREAQECADLFQRSSSCVEGRNGQLALRHHSLHRLSPKKLEALTVVHNYFLVRADGTTAAERFFGVKPTDMFEWVLDHIDVPARPAQARAKARRIAA